MRSAHVLDATAVAGEIGNELCGRGGGCADPLHAQVGRSRTLQPRPVLPVPPCCPRFPPQWLYRFDAGSAAPEPVRGALPYTETVGTAVKGVTASP
jgi:hypothetical protein